MGKESWLGKLVEELRETERNPRRGELMGHLQFRKGKDMPYLPEEVRREMAQRDEALREGLGIEDA